MMKTEMEMKMYKAIRDTQMEYKNGLRIEREEGEKRGGERGKKERKNRGKNENR